MNQTQQKLVLETMEHQKIGIRCEMNGLWYHSSNTTIISTATLNNNVFDYSKSIKQNVKVNSDLLNRFDMIFLIDQTDSSEDGSPQPETVSHRDIRDGGKCVSLNLVRDYLNHCKSVQPFMPVAIQHQIYDHCLSPAIKMNPELCLSKLRVYENLCRLAQAHAKMFLRHRVTDHDVNSALQISSSSFTYLHMEQSELSFNFLTNKTMNSFLQALPKSDLRFVSPVK